jgi:hypothetical protein
MTRAFNVFLLAALFLSSSVALMAQVYSPEVGPPAQFAMTLAAPSPEIPVDDFLAELFRVIEGMGGAPGMVKISAIITLLLSSMKVSVLNKVVWQKLGPAKAWAAPSMGLAAGIAGLVASGAPLTLPVLVAYFSAGSGAIVLHQLMDSLKQVPGIGGAYLRVIESASKWLGGDSEKPTQ